jgi:formylglycine-generating enzyme required for sulfatase activity
VQPRAAGGAGLKAKAVSICALAGIVLFGPTAGGTPIHADGAAAARGDVTACPADMVEVEGEYCPTVEQHCTRWLDSESRLPRRCAEYEPNAVCRSSTSPKHFCIDRYEFPNQPGAKPIVMRSWANAQAACHERGKRLCGDSEWTLACEGSARLPYPYGTKRDAKVCNIDKPYQPVDEGALADPRRRDREVARLWQAEPSGSRAACVSPYGVFDMTGNVDEWVVNESGRPHRSGSKGGYWGPVRDRCRPMTTVHSEDFSFYQLGFRCCEDPLASHR